MSRKSRLIRIGTTIVHFSEDGRALTNERLRFRYQRQVSEEHAKIGNEHGNHAQVIRHHRARITTMTSATPRKASKTRQHETVHLFCISTSPKDYAKRKRRFSRVVSSKPAKATTVCLSIEPTPFLSVAGEFRGRGWPRLTCNRAVASKTRGGETRPGGNALPTSSQGFCVTRSIRATGFVWASKPVNAV